MSKKLRDALKDYLRDNMATAGERIYPGQRAPQKTSDPYISFFQVGKTRYYDHSGPDGSAEARFQFDMFARTLEDVLDMEKELKVIDGFSGNIDGVKIAAVFLVNEFDDFLDSTGFYNVQNDYRIQFYEESD